MESSRGLGASGAILSQDFPALSPAERRELNSLQAERDVELFWSGLLRLAGRLESRDKLEAAVSLYARAVAEAPEGLRAKAQARLDAIEGQGAVGARVEFHLSRLAHDAMDYRMILPMMAGSSVYSLAKGAALGRFAAATHPLWWMRGAPGRLSAASLGYFAEVPVFALSSRFLQGLGGRTPSASWGQELSSAAITLGMLKSGGALAQSGLHRILGSNAAPGLRFATGQAAMFAGLWSAHRVEEKLRLRPAREGDTAVTDLLASMVSLGLGAQLGKRLLGPGHARRGAELELRIQDRAATINLPRFFPAKPVAAGFGLGPMLMSAENGNSDDRPVPPVQSVVQVSSSEVRARKAMRILKGGGKTWSEIHDLAGKLAEEIRSDRRWTSAGRGRLLSYLADIAQRFGPERGNPELAWIALTQLSEVRTLETGELEYNNRILRLDRDGELSLAAKSKPVSERPELPPRSGDTGHAVVFRTFDFFAQREPAWREALKNFRGTYEALNEREHLRDRLVDMMERSLELAQQGSEFTPPLAERWLKAFEEAARGERSLEGFEAIDPLNFKAKPPVAASPPEPAASRPESPPPASQRPAAPEKITNNELVTVGDFASAFRLFSIGGAFSGGNKDFQLRLILPNLDQASWKIRADAQGNLSLLENGQGQWRSAQGKSSSLQVQKVEGFSTRFRVQFGSKRLLLDLQSIQDRNGTVARLELAPNQSVQENPLAEHFPSQAPRLEKVEVEHAEAISLSTLRGQSGAQLRYQFYLSNGDLVELTGQTSNKGGGQFEVKQAWLKRFGDSEDSARALEVSSSRVKPGQFRLLLNEPMGYRFDFEIRVPTTGGERWRPQWSRLDVLEAPPPTHLRWSEKPGSRAELDSTEAESSIRGLAADALFGDIPAIEKMGTLGRIHDSAIWELKDLFEMTWDPKLKPEDFGSFDVIRLREKIGEALRDSAKQNPMAKKVIGELENNYGIASMLEAAPALPSLPPLVPPPAPPAAPVSPAAAKSPGLPTPVSPLKSEIRTTEAKPAPKAKPALSKQETLDLKIQAFLQPRATKSYPQGLIKEISKLVAEIDSGTARALMEKHFALLPKAIQSQDWSRIFPLLHVTESLAPSLHPEARPEHVRRMAELADEMMGLPDAFRQMLAFSYSRTIYSRDAIEAVFQKKPGDSKAIADLRKLLDQVRRIPMSDMNAAVAGLTRIYAQAQSLKPEEAEAFRVELWGAMQLRYIDFNTRLKSNPDSQAILLGSATLSVMFRAFLGATDQMAPEAREVFLDRAGFWRQGQEFRFQPFPGVFTLIMQWDAKLPPLTPAAPASSQAKPK